MTLTYCGGDARQAESVCGWGRPRVELGLAARRPDILCLGAPSAGRGRTRWEDEHPHVAEALGPVAEAQAHHDPTVRTSWASTRLTAQATLKAWHAQGSDTAHLPAPRTMARGLTRLGWRFRQVVKATPHKKRTETAAIVDHSKKSGPSARSGPGQTREERLASDGAPWRPVARWSHPRRTPRLCS
jgi:hypothetical protein